jgi:dTDP-4-dehydrorhamnose 3,5-epimerase
VKLSPAKLPGVYAIEPKRLVDERGYFARTYCERELAEQGIVCPVVQANMSWNERAGTLRGLHYQASPHGETKLVRCSRGRIYDVVLDLRRASPTFLSWQAYELSPDDGRILLVPPGVAHGFQTLVDDTEVTYQVSTDYVAEAGRGVRWNDPTFAIEWPHHADRILSERDRSHPDFDRDLGGE